MIIQDNKEGQMTLELFKKAFESANFKATSEIIEEVYFKFDYNKDGSVSFNEFLNIILGGDKSNTF